MAEEHFDEWRVGTELEEIQSRKELSKEQLRQLAECYQKFSKEALNINMSAEKAAEQVKIALKNNTIRKLVWIGPDRKIRAFTFFSINQKAKELHVHSVYSSEKGLGTTLYNCLHNIAAQEGMETMSALPAHRSESAQRFHGRLGGRIVEKPFGDPAKGGMTVKYWRQVVHKEPFTTISAFGTRRGGSRIKQMFMR